MGQEGLSWPGGAPHGMGGDVGGGPNPGDPDYVRPADPYKRQRLVDDTRSHGYGGMSTMRPWGGAPTSAAIPFRDFAQESRQASNAFAAKGGDRSSNSAVNEKHRKLAYMFSPPTELMFMGDFQAARQAAKQQKKWLLVNIQADGEFDCHRLNRDVWKDEMVQNIIQCNCIFWQVEHAVVDMNSPFFQYCKHCTNMCLTPSNLSTETRLKPEGFRGGKACAGWCTRGMCSCVEGSLRECG
ncbi:unnamed protein product [Laminaria digitata]